MTEEGISGRRGLVTGGAENALRISVENGSGNKVKGSPVIREKKRLKETISQLQTQISENQAPLQVQTIYKDSSSIT